MVSRLNQVIPLCSFSCTQFNWRRQLPAQWWDLTLHFLPSLTCSKHFRKIEATDGSFCSAEQWWLTAEITQDVGSIMLWEAWHSEQMNFTVFHSFSSTTSTWLKQNFHIISYPESSICHMLNKPLFQWWWIRILNKKGLFHVLLCKDMFVCL